MRYPQTAALSTAAPSVSFATSHAATKVSAADLKFVMKVR